MNRRKWLKASAALAGAFTIAPGAIGAAASPIRALRMNTLSRYTESAIANEFPQLKARLFANENPFGPSDKAKQAIIDSVSRSYLYPIFEGEQLAEKIALSDGFKKENIAISSGSTTILHAASVYFAGDGAEIISGDPSYDDLTKASEKLKAKWIKVPLNNSYQLDLDAMEKLVTDKTSLVYICNPNNPTGTTLDREKLKNFCERVSKKTTVFIDEAYIHYMGNPDDHTMMGLVKDGHNVIVARTFSKLYGFAGLRVGYIISQPAIIEQLRLFAWLEAGLSYPSVAALTASYDDKEFLQVAFKKTMESKEYLYNVLKKEGYEYIPSSTNFVMFPINMDAERFVEEMMKRGVGVRPWKFNDKNWCRVSIGTMEDMKYFAEAFKQIS
ncbi:MAG TPA: histidinol-phosphate transaminase [Cyclobacteriaceae bacterium]|nr:histidinol-phosphate transaminase [Cyclobacteriaceae bacterium]